MISLGLLAKEIHFSNRLLHQQDEVVVQMPIHSREHIIVHNIKTLDNRGEHYEENPQVDAPEEPQTHAPKEPQVDSPEDAPEVDNNVMVAHAEEQLADEAQVILMESLKIEDNVPVD